MKFCNKYLKKTLTVSILNLVHVTSQRQECADFLINYIYYSIIEMSPYNVQKSPNVCVLTNSLVYEIQIGPK